MLDKYYNDIKDQTDLNIYRFGIEDCVPDYNWGPALKDHFSIHYIFQGKGEFIINDTSYELGVNQGFLIPPNTVVSYKADHKNPWSYCWVGFHGLKAEYHVNKIGLKTQNPTFTCRENTSMLSIVKDMLACKNYKKGRDIKLLSNLYLFLYELTESIDNNEAHEQLQSGKEEYLNASVDFILKNYSMPISIQEIADHAGIDRSYLYLIFKEYLNISPSEYLIRLRTDVAKELLCNKALSIGNISRSVGYGDQFVFSKTFKKVTGLSPEKYRLSNQLSCVVKP